MLQAEHLSNAELIVLWNRLNISKRKVKELACLDSTSEGFDNSLIVSLWKSIEDECVLRDIDVQACTITIPETTEDITNG
ncbi:MAG: hypothetical protein V3S69_02585 [Dehalococcoidales bacterium]